MEPYQSSPPSCAITPTFGQFEYTRDHYNDLAPNHQFAVLDAGHGIGTHLDPSHVNNLIQGPLAPNPFILPTQPISPNSQALLSWSQDPYPNPVEANQSYQANALPNMNYRYMHGPLQAERLEQRDERVCKQDALKETKQVQAEQRALAKQAKETAAQAERERRVAEKAAKDAEKAARETAAKEEKECKAEAKAAKEEAARVAKAAKDEATRLAKEAAAVERAAKEAKAQEAKAAKEAAKEEKAKAKALEAKDKTKIKDGRRSAGDSDVEIEAVQDRVGDADIKPLEMKKVTKRWTPEECIATAEYIMSKWSTFKLKQTHVFRTVSKEILNGSKTESQVGNWWGNQWKKFKACLRQEVHTGGGDGDVLDHDANHNDESKDDSDVEILPDETQGTIPGIAVDQTGLTRYTESQLDMFEQSEVYKIILKVAKRDPEAAKQEDFDSARAFSDSETGLPSPSKPKSSSRSTEDSKIEDLLRATMGTVGAAVADMATSRKAAAEAARKKEEREEKAATEEGSYRKRHLELEESKHVDLQRHNQRQNDIMERRLRLDEQEARDRRRREAIAMLSHENNYVKAKGECILKAVADEENLASKG